jgi:integrase
MINDEHNTEVARPLAKPILTFADLHSFVGASDMPSGKKRLILSALKVTDRLIGNGCLDLAADPDLVMRRLRDWTPAMAGMTPGAFANLKSRVRAAFRMARPQLTNPRHRPPLTGDWAWFREALDPGARLKLSRVIHFAFAAGWTPSEFTDDHLARFEHHLRAEAMVQDWNGVIRSTISAWNSLPTVDEPGGLHRLTPPALKRTPYWIKPEHWPQGPRADLEKLLQQLVDPNIYRGKKVRKRKATTVQQYHNLTVTLVSAIVGSGVPLERLQSLADALHPDHVEAALGFLATRGDKITVTMLAMMIKVVSMARMCGLPDEQIEELKAIQGNVEAHAPPERQRRTMTAKNRKLLDRVANDQRFADLIFTMPERLRDEAHAPRVSAERAAYLMRTALALELLLTCSMRRENLVTLELDTSIKRHGKQPGDPWVIEIEAEDVKNHESLRFRLTGATVALLEDYLANWRTTLSPKPNMWLFPSPDGEASIDPKTMSEAIRSQSLRILGVPLTPHQFRHISADSFLEQHPDKLDLASAHLGHRDPNTTRYYYARSKQKQASRAYQEHVVKAKGDASRRLAGKKVRKPQPSGDKL